jgi:hypothetical protein
MKTKLLSLISIAVLCVILALGLWPLHVPANDVAWLPDRPGLSFGRNSVALTPDAIRAVPSGRESGASVEIWLMPSRIWDSGTFLGFCEPGEPYKLSLRQSQIDLEIRTAGETRLQLNRAFQRVSREFVTVTSGASGTMVYVDGRLVGSAPSLRLTAQDFAGRLVVGDSPGQTDSWQGRLFGLAIYHHELSQAEVASHYRTWTQQARPEIPDAERNVALYLLNEGGGSVAHNSAASGPDLQIPGKYAVVDQIFLEPFWQEFSWSQSYWGATEKNIVGFIPLGFCFYAYLTALRMRRVGLVTVLLGTTVSVIIEVLQFFLPTRDSGTTDIFTNTLGTWIGVTAYRMAEPMLARVLLFTADRLRR